MTTKRSEKRAARERMVKTGESYQAALQALRKERGELQRIRPPNSEPGKLEAYTKAPGGEWKRDPKLDKPAPESAEVKAWARKMSEHFSDPKVIAKMAGEEADRRAKLERSAKPKIEED